MLSLNQPPLTQHISVPKDLSQLSVEAFTAGIIEGVLDGLNVVSHLSIYPCPTDSSLNSLRCQPARVTAHTVPTKDYPNRTVILVKLDQVIMDREEGLGK